jgi:hypothetical protein
MALHKITDILITVSQFGKLFFAFQKASVLA